MLPHQVLKLLNVFDAFGFDSGSSRLSRDIRFTRCIYFVHVLIATFCTLFLFYLIVTFYPEVGFIEATNSFFQYFVGLSTYWIIILDSYVHRNTHEIFWTKVENFVSNSFGSSNNIPRSYMVKFIQFFSTTFLVFVIRVICGSHVDLTSDFLHQMYQTRMFYYFFCLLMIGFQLNTIEDEVTSCLSLVNINEIECSYWELERLKSIRERFHCVYEMINYVNKIFGWSHVAAISSCFYLLLTEMNWLYSRFDEFSYIFRIGKCFMYSFHEYLHS